MTSTVPSADGIPLHYEVHGTGAPALVLDLAGHSVGGDLNVADRQLDETIADLTARVRPAATPTADSRC